jgi:hypothetical protein
MHTLAVVPTQRCLHSCVPTGTGKLSRHDPRFGSTTQLAAAFGFNPYGSQTGSTSMLAPRSHDKESWWQKTLSLRNTSIALDDILQVCPSAPYRSKPNTWYPAHVILAGLQVCSAGRVYGSVHQDIHDGAMGISTR